MRVAPICLLLTCLFCGGPLAAEDAAPPAPPATPTAPAPEVDVAAASARSTALRAALAEPTKPWRFEGDSYFHGFWIGSVTIEAEPGTFQEKPCWQVVERTVREAGKARVLSEHVLTLAQDLSLLRGETVYRAPGGSSVTAFGWRDGVLEVVDQPEGGAPRSATPKVARDATLGLFALAHFVAHLPKEPERDWRLPVFDARFAFGDDAGKPLATDLADLALTVLGPSHLFPAVHCSLPPNAFAVKAEAAWGRSLTLKMQATSRALLAVDGGLPRGRIWRTGLKLSKTPPPWFDHVGQPPTSALDAFVSFGRGYHLPDRKLLESAFHWPSMRAAEIAAGSYPADVTEEKVRQDWVAEFEAKSKHRTEADCDDLLLQLLITAKIVSNEDGSVSITALPVFGGHVFHCASIDGRWWITKLD